jgi:hypothetical protein
MDSATYRFDFGQEGSAVTVCHAGRRLVTLYFLEPGHGAAFATRVKEATTLDQVIGYIWRTLRLYCDFHQQQRRSSSDGAAEGPGTEAERNHTIRQIQREHHFITGE